MELAGIMKNKRLHFIAGCAALLLMACNGSTDSAQQSGPAIPQQAAVIVPSDLPRFSGDSAYAFTAKQVAFGPRVPNTPSHRACGDWLIATLKRLGAEVVVQPGIVTAHTGENLQIRNIMGRFKSDVAERIMLSAHWDTRPYSDRDKMQPKERFDGAVDGASGVGVLLEIARVIAQKEIPIGLDIVFFDAEDFGTSEDSKSYCLGSQLFAGNPPVSPFAPKYGILLDMVGAPGATFFKEGYSMQYAPKIVNKVWSMAKAMGHGAYFRNELIGPITDDHYFMNSIAQIPTIDIIHHQQDSPTGFGHYWHTQLDNMEMVDSSTLQVVGEVLLGVLYSEKAAVSQAVTSETP